MDILIANQLQMNGTLMAISSVEVLLLILALLFILLMVAGLLLFAIVGTVVFVSYQKADKGVLPARKVCNEQAIGRL